VKGGLIERFMLLWRSMLRLCGTGSASVVGSSIVLFLGPREVRRHWQSQWHAVTRVNV
jgi:hypothetical protein